MGFSLSLELSHDKVLVNLPTISSPKLTAAKYTKKDLQKIFKIVIEARAFPLNRTRKKSVKIRSPGVYCGKFHIECYNFYQQCKDYFATAGAKSYNHIPFATFFLYDRINFCWQQYKRKHKAESSVFIT